LNFAAPKSIEIKDKTTTFAFSMMRCKLFVFYDVFVRSFLSAKYSGFRREVQRNCNGMNEFQIRHTPGGGGWVPPI